MVKTAIESLYEGVCTISEYTAVKDATTKITTKQEVVVQSSIPCRLSYRYGRSAMQGDATSVTQQIELFLAPEITVKAGSKITVSQNGRTTAYKNSGQPAVYASHQQIMLELFTGWA